jgi:hypothetical protein
VSGVEFFLYNRTAAYDAIISRAQEQVREEQEKKDGRGDTGTEGRRSGYSSGGTSETRKRTGWTADRENGAEEEGKSGMASDGPAPGELLCSRSFPGEFGKLTRFVYTRSNRPSRILYHPLQPTQTLQNLDGRLQVPHHLLTDFLCLLFRPDGLVPRDSPARDTDPDR